MLYMNHASGRGWVWFMVLMWVMMWAQDASAYMYIQQGISGPPVVRGDQVYFTQADERITVLAMEGGHVLARLDEPRGVYRLTACETGLLAQSHDSIHMLDWKTLDVLWTSDHSASTIVSHKGLLIGFGWDDAWAIDSRNGQEVWTDQGDGEHGYAERIVIVGDQAMLVYQNNDYDNSYTDLKLIDPLTGETRWSTRLPEQEGGNYDCFAFDGTDMFAVASPAFLGRNKAPLTGWRVDEDGVLHPVADAVSKWGEDGGYTIDGRRFAFDGSPVGVAGDVSDRNQGYLRNGVYQFDSFRIIDESLAWPNGRAKRLRYVGGDREWRCVVPHARARGDDLSITEIDGDRLLFWTDRGQVECIDRWSGRSQWLYVSPWTRGTLSVTGNSAPFVSELVSEFDRERASATKREPSAVVPASVDWGPLTDEELLAAVRRPAVPVVEDPEPFDPFAEVRGRLLMVRLLPALFVVVGLGVYWWSGKYSRHPRRVRVLGAAVLFSLIVPVVVFHGKMSLFTLVALSLLAWLLIAVVGWWAWLAVKQWRYPVSTACAVVLMVVVAKSSWYAVSWFLSAVPGLIAYGYRLWEVRADAG